jgi:hypothetical protein
MKPRTIDPPRTKPAGGYVLCAVGGLFALWWLRKLGILRGLDFRVFFALLEMQARRCDLPAGRDPRYSLLELSRLCGGTSEPELKRALRRLRKVGFVKGFTRATLVLARNAGDLALDDETREFLDEKFLLLRSPKRLVPLPRRMVRLLASGACMTFAAVILGTAIATLFFKRGVITARGAYKASWLAEAFGISERTVYRHRTYLVEELRWLKVIASPQLRQNANGLLVEVDLDWDGAPPVPASIVAKPEASHGAGESKRTPDSTGMSIAPEPDCQAPPAQNGGHLSGPRDLYKEPFQEELNNKPAPGGGPGSGNGVYQPKISDSDRNSNSYSNPNPERNANASANSTGAKPNLKRVTLADLKDPARLAELHAQAVAEKLITGSENDRLQFFAAAERAKTVGSKNPPGLFVRIVRSGLWRFLSQDDEEAARRKIRALLYPEARPESNGRHGPFSGLSDDLSMDKRSEAPRPRLSEDALIVRAVTNALKRAGYRGDPFYALKRERPEWTRDRWNAALAELGQPVGSHAGALSL